MTKRRELFDRLFRQAKDREPDIQWGRSVPHTIRTPLIFLSFEYNIRIDELFKAMRYEAMEQMKETDASDFHVGAGHIHSHSGRVLDYEIDFAEAWTLAQRDQWQNTQALERNPSLEQLIAIQRNTIGWMYFMSVRHPSAAHRPRFAQLAADGAHKLHELLRVKLCGRKWIDSTGDCTTGTSLGGGECES